MFLYLLEQHVISCSFFVHHYNFNYDFACTAENFPTFHVFNHRVTK